MSFPRYPKYKDSGVEWLGEVPEHWGVERLKRIAHVFSSNVDKKSADGELPVRLCNYTDVYYNDTIVDDLDFMEATATPDQVAKFTLRAGDTIITKDSETADDIAVSAYVPQDLPGVVCGYHLSIVRPDKGAAGAFFKRFFDSRFAKASVAVLANGLTRVGLSQYALDNLAVPFPPWEEQSCIASFLVRETAKIDELVAEQQRLMELLKEKRQAVISHPVTKGLNPDAPMKPSGVEWLGEVPAHWEVGRLKHYISRIEQGSSPQCLTDAAPDDSWGVLKVGCVNGDAFNPAEQKELPDGETPDSRFEVHPGDILMSRGNTLELVGGIAFVPSIRSKLLLSDLLYRFRADPSLLEGEFLALALRTKESRFQIESAATGTSASMKKISQGDIKELVFTCPPLEEQRRIIDRVAEVTQKIDSLMAAAVAVVALLGERRSALISAAVTGQIDVRKLATAEAA